MRYSLRFLKVLSKVPFWDALDCQLSLQQQSKRWWARKSALRMPRNSLLASFSQLPAHDWLKQLFSNARLWHNFTQSLACFIISVLHLQILLVLKQFNIFILLALENFFVVVFSSKRRNDRDAEWGRGELSKSNWRHHKSDTCAGDGIDLLSVCATWTVNIVAVLRLINGNGGRTGGFATGLFGKSARVCYCCWQK